MTFSPCFASPSRVISSARALIPLPLLMAVLLAGCASEPTAPVEEAAVIANQPKAMQPRKPADMKTRIVRFLPRQVQDKPGWANDVVTALSTQGLTVSDHNVCSVLAVAEQEATYQADPVVPGLGKIAWKEINARAAKLLIPEFVVRTALSIKSPTGKSYAARIDALRTEREMSEIFEDMIGAVPMGKQLFGNLNPVRTGGPMQVSIAFAEANARGYPYPVKESIRHEVFTRRGGIWFGTKHIFGYPADYPDTLYRFADFNAGWYASRNAAFQAAVSRVSGKPLALDGDLVLRLRSARQDRARGAQHREPRQHEQAGHPPEPAQGGQCRFCQDRPLPSGLHPG